MKLIIAVAALAAACVVAPVTLNAQDHSSQNHADSPASFANVTLVQWSGRVTQEIESGLRYPMFPSNEVPADGMVQVAFRCSKSGASDQASVYRSSGSPILDRAALKAVKRLKQLHPLATGISDKQKYVAMVVFATSPTAHARQMTRINAEMRKRNAWFKGNVQTASAGIMLAPVGS